MIAALLCRPVELEVAGERVRVRRPTVADFVAAVDASGRGAFMPAWFVATHALDGDAQAFESIDQVMRLDGNRTIALGKAIEKLYEEGLDLLQPPAKS